MSSLPFQRILIKLSGERMADKNSGGVLSNQAIEGLADQLIDVYNTGVQVAVVLGGGNILRGHEAAEAGFEEAGAHNMGMLATVINALALQSILEQKGRDTRVMTAVPLSSFAEPYIRRRALRHMDKGRIVICAGGTGNPFFTTDTAGALRAIELGADLLIKGSKVDGIYDKDPHKHTDAQHIADISYKDVLSENLQVMDGAAVALCRDNQLPLMVCSIEEPGGLIKALTGEARRTLVTA